ncbi:MAG: DUF2147 domain-containing protein [Halopseudomonas sp.]|uniref:DUF2147 domain-containing protein n=1 Tax=Halopseudomonas sp. TaxID=2901191 RepID=UPI0030027D98
MHHLLRARHVVLALIAVFISSVAWADNSSPEGLWKSIDDNSGKPRALIRIVEQEGTLRGTIEEVFPQPGKEQQSTCKECEGENKDAPIVGLTILTGLQKEGDEYTGGEILDPENGKVYSSKAELIEGGDKLQVRGYIGTPILGRTQTWIRQE